MLATFRASGAAQGFPPSTLTDDGRVFTVRLFGGTTRGNHLEHELRGRNITQKNGPPNRPQAQGEVERFQQTLEKRLRAQPTSLAELQTLLPEFVVTHNTLRPHRSLPKRATPATIYRSLPKAAPSSDRSTDTHYRPNGVGWPATLPPSSRRPPSNAPRPSRSAPRKLGRSSSSQRGVATLPAGRSPWPRGSARATALGARWQDLDLEADSWPVVQGLQRQAYRQGCASQRYGQKPLRCPKRIGGLVFVEPKSEKGKRTRGIPRELVTALTLQRRQQDQERHAAGSMWQKHGLVIATSAGRRIHPRRD